MVLTKSKVLDVTFTAPDFALPEPLTGKTVSLGDVRGAKGTCVIFTCVHCPFAVHLQEGFARIAGAAKAMGIATVAISSNDAVTYPADAPDKMKQLAQTVFTGDLPFLYDESQEIARSYGAVCTPDIYLFDSADKLYYQYVSISIHIILNSNL